MPASYRAVQWLRAQPEVTEPSDLNDAVLRLAATAYLGRSPVLLNWRGARRTGMARPGGCVGWLRCRWCGCRECVRICCATPL